MEAEKDVGEAGGGGRYEGWLEQGACVLSIKVDRLLQSDCHQVEANIAPPDWGTPPDVKHWSVPLSLDRRQH